MKKKKAGKKPWEPPTEWDHGPNTQAARAMTVVEDAGEIDPKTGKRVNPNGVKRLRRICVTEWYYRRGHLTRRQADAANKLLSAWEQTLRGPPAIKEINVDSSPKPDANVAIQIDRISGFHNIMRKAPSKYAAYIDHVVIHNRPINSMPGAKRDGKYMKRLAAGLDLLADAIEGKRE